MATEKEHNQVCIDPNCYIAKEIKYQTALLHEILNEQQELKYIISHELRNNGKQSPPLSVFLKLFRRKDR